MDDAVDEPGSAEASLDRLEELERGLEGQPEVDGSPLWPALGWVRENFDIPVEYFRDLLKGARTDLREVRLESMAELDQYCYRVAGTVGLMSLKVMEAPVDRLRPPALALARAFQITNILRDVGEDHRRERCYLPLELLKKHDARQAWENRQMNAGLEAVLEKLAGRARQNYRRGVKLLAEVSWRQRLTLALMTAAYSYYLKLIEKNDFPVWENKISLKKTVIPGLIFDSMRTLTGANEKCLQIS